MAVDPLKIVIWASDRVSHIESSTGQVSRGIMPFSKPQGVSPNFLCGPIHFGSQRISCNNLP